MSPSKYQVFESMFDERLCSLSLTKTEKNTRNKRLNILLKSAITNVTKQNAKQTEEIFSTELMNKQTN